MSVEQGGQAAAHEFIERYSEDHADRLPLLAREINASGADVIVAVSDVSIRAALAATKSTPIVMVAGDDPVTTGLVASFAHPGGRVTGVYFHLKATRSASSF
jgi:putative ABC transport system substrate-binding protein